jgi:hypothetical protein
VIKDTSLQSLPCQLRTAATIPIGGCPPLEYGAQVIPGKHQSLFLWTEGTTNPAEYPAVMWNPASPRPILPNSGNVSQSFKYAVGGNLAGMNVLETDLILVIAGYKYNGSCQFQQGQGYQVVDSSGDWVPTGINPIGKLTPNLPYSTEVSYAFDLLNHTLSVTTIAVNGVPFPVNSSTPQKVPAQMSTWLPGAYSQIQLGSVPSAQGWSAKLKDLTLNWW